VNVGPWLEELAVVSGVFLLAGWIAWLGFRHAARVLDVRKERERTLREALARMESAERAVAFLGSDEGRALLGEAPLAERSRGTLLGLLGGAAFSGALGVALLAIAARQTGAVDPNAVASREAALWWGTILCALSVAALVLAAAARFLSAPEVRRDAGGGRPRGDGREG
jgi:hypothetical protein